MPMTWDAAADAKLFTVVMAVYDIKISGAQNERIAKLMGDDVTPKAITHRLSKIKAQAATSHSRSGPSTPSSNRKPPAKPPTFKSTKGGSGKGKGLGMPSVTHTRTTIMTDDGEDDEEDFATPTKLPTNILEAIKKESGGIAAKKRKIGPKIEGFADEEEVVFGAEEGDGDAIDFSLHYPAAVVKMEEGGGGDVVAKEEEKRTKAKQNVEKRRETECYLSKKREA